MKTYHEKTGELIENPNLEEGFTYPGQRYIGTERVVLEGTVELYPPDGLGYDKPVYEDCLWYHEYTEDELAAQHPPDDPKPSDMEERLKAVEDKLQAAKILLGVE
ncbi:hypothetical protein [uncultured Subdoligranulum sp.]|uniref:hypothetical protein n=1 Tax=uncultured Subdoligranulum sp. TaxID=512298 RepID=UPI0025DF14EB|nr:hypothetical protein [uncultured Subdoligranulum sp.]